MLEGSAALQVDIVVVHTVVIEGVVEWVVGEEVVVVVGFGQVGGAALEGYADGVAFRLEGIGEPLAHADAGIGGKHLVKHNHVALGVGQVGVAGTHRTGQPHVGLAVGRHAFVVVELGGVEVMVQQFGISVHCDVVVHPVVVAVGIAALAFQEVVLDQDGSLGVRLQNIDGAAIHMHRTAQRLDMPVRRCARQRVGQVLHDGDVVHQIQGAAVGHADGAVAVGLVTLVAIPVLAHQGAVLQGHHAAVLHSDDGTEDLVGVGILPQFLFLLLVLGRSHSIVKLVVGIGPGGSGIDYIGFDLRDVSSAEVDAAGGKGTGVFHLDHGAAIHAFLVREQVVVTVIADDRHRHVFVAADEHLAVVNDHGVEDGHHVALLEDVLEGVAEVRQVGVGVLAAAIFNIQRTEGTRVLVD